MADIDIRAEAEKLGVPVDESNPQATIKGVLDAMMKQRDEAVSEAGSADERSEKLMASLETAVGALDQKARNGDAAPTPGMIEGTGQIQVDPSALLDAQEKAGLDPDRTRQVQDQLAKATVLPTPGGSLRSYLRRANEHPLYTQVAQDDDQRAMQEWNDQLYIMSHALGCHPTELKLWRETIEIPAVREAVNKTPHARWAAGSGRMMHGKDATDALVSDTSSQGGDWVPVAMSQSIFEDIRSNTVVAQQLQQVTMPSLTMKMPYNAGNATTYLTSQGVNQTPAALDTGGPTLTAKGFGTAMEFTGEMEEDSIAPVLPIVRQTMVSDQAESLESALINGDDGTHFDGAAVDGGSGDVRNAWDGFRFLTFTGSLTTDLNTLNVEALRGLTSSMGKYAANPKDLFYLTGLKIRVKLLSLKDNQNNQAVLTMSQLGPNATIITGQIADIDGTPVLISGQYPEWETSLGAYGDSGGTPSPYTQSSVCLINKRMFYLGNRRPLRIEQDRVILGDYTVVVAKSRWAFVPAIACNTSYPCAWRGINMNTT